MHWQTTDGCSPPSQRPTRREVRGDLKRRQLPVDRTLARNAAITLDTDTITQPVEAQAPAPTTTTSANPATHARRTAPADARTADPDLPPDNDLATPLCPDGTPEYTPVWTYMPGQAGCSSDS
jgi:hypothetical protein